jgi:hypothetical protein
VRSGMDQPIRYSCAEPGLLLRLGGDLAVTGSDSSRRTLSPRSPDMTHLFAPSEPRPGSCQGGSAAQRGTLATASDEPLCPGDHR